MSTRSVPLVAAACCLLATSCFSYKEVTLQGINAVELSSMDEHGVAFTVEAVIDNPNGYRIKARDPDVDLFVNGQAMGKATVDSVLTLDKHSSRSYSVPVRATIGSDKLAGILLTSAFTGTVELRASGSVVGQAGFFKRRFPFEVEQVVELSE